MAEDLNNVVEQALARAFEAKIAELRTAVRDEVLQSVKPWIEAANQTRPSATEYAPGSAPTDLLNAAVASIYDAQGQADILRSLLDGCAQFTGRAVLLVVKG